MGLADELLKLAELKKEGLLSEEEFLEAKKKIIGSENSTPSSAPKTAIPIKVDANFNALVSSDSIGFAVNDAVELLITLLRNVAKNSTEQKFRILKLQNERLSTRLFPVDGVVDFLESIGFQHHPDAGTYVLDVLPANLEDIISHLARVPLIREVNANKEAKQKLQASIRMEKREDNKKNGNTAGFTKSELMCSCGDFEEKFKWMKKVIEGVANGNDTDNKYRKVKLTPKFISECWSRHGSQEFLLDVAGWEVSPDGNHITCDTTEQVQQEAIQYLSSIFNTYLEQEQAEEEEKRNAARKQIKDLIERRRKDKSQTPVTPSGKRVPMSEALKYLTGQVGDSDACLREEQGTAERIIADIAGMMV